MGLTSARRQLFLLGVFAAVLLSPSIAFSDPAKEAELEARIRHWTRHLPLCDYKGGSFPSKYKRPTAPGQVEGPGCEDGDSVLFNGLTCAAGDDRGCTAVARSQATDGQWWRSPKRLYERYVDPSGEETIFSNDHALGAWAYIAQEKDRSAFKRWIASIRRSPGRREAK